MNSFAYNTTGDTLLDAASALLAGQSLHIDEATELTEANAHSVILAAVSAVNNIPDENLENFFKLLQMSLSSRASEANLSGDQKNADVLHDVAKAVGQTIKVASKYKLNEAALKEILPTKENKQQLASFMKKFNALRDVFPDVVIRGTHDEKVEARLLDNGNVVQYLNAKIPFVHGGK